MIKKILVFLLVLLFITPQLSAQFKKLKKSATKSVNSAAENVKANAAKSGSAVLEVAKKGFKKVAKPIPFEIKSYELKLNDPRYNVMGYSIDDFMKKTFIPALSKALNALPASTKVYIYGHASATGSENGSSTFIGNKKLSRKRAEAMRDYLVGHSSLNKDKFKLVALSSSSPVSGESAENNVNCRVTFELK